MLSACDSAASHEDGGSDEFQLLKDADRLVTEHGQDADHVAAHRADSLFRDGDLHGGSRWLKIFRRIAMAHRRGAAE
jgi:hypothetical protein